MQLRAILVLLVLALALGAALWLKEEEARRDPDGLEDYAVFAGVDAGSVRTLEVRHFERHWQVRLERDERGAWFVTDPLPYPADEGAVRQLLEQVRGLRGEAVPELDDPSKVGLDPPRALVVVGARGPDGAERTARVELGAIDLDGELAYLRAGGRVLRARRTLDNALLSSEQDFRSRRMLEVSPLEQVIELTRAGALEGRDLAFSAQLDGAGWRLVEPYRAALDPLTTHIFVQQLLGSRVDGFHSDDPGPLSDYGLDPPDLSLRIATARGDEATLLFGRPSPDGPWLCARAGNPFVWRAEARDVTFLAAPPDDLLDYRITRAKRDDVREVVLTWGERETHLARVGAEWRVAEGPPAPEREEAPADDGRAGDLLAGLESAELARYLPPGTPFEPADPPRSVRIETVDGDVWGGELGAPHAVPGADPARTFRRFGDDLVAVVDERVAELATLSAEELRSLVLVKLVEREQRAVRVRRGGDEAVFELDRRENVWKAQGTGLEARRFAELVDRVLSVRARRWLAPEEVPGDGAGVEVEVEPVAGEPVRYRLVAGPDGTELCEARGRWGEVRPGLLERLAALLD